MPKRKSLRVAEVLENPRRFPPLIGPREESASRAAGLCDVASHASVRFALIVLACAAEAHRRDRVLCDDGRRCWDTVFGDEDGDVFVVSLEATQVAEVWIGAGSVRRLLVARLAPNELRVVGVDAVGDEQTGPRSTRVDMSNIDRDIVQPNGIDVRFRNAVVASALVVERIERRPTNRGDRALASVSRKFV